MRPKLAGVLALVVLGLLPRTASAQADARAACAVRVETLRRLLTEEAARASTWTVSWTAGFGAAAAGQLAATAFVDREDRKDLYVGSAASALGLVPLVAFPLPVVADAPAFAARASAPGADPCALAEEGQRLVDESAKAEAFGTGVVAHVGNALFNVALGLFLGVGFGHWESGAVNVALGTAVGEALILTQPTGLLHVRERGAVASLSF